MARHAPGNDQNDVESHIAHGIFRMARKPEQSRRDDAALLPLADRFRSGIEAIAGLHFDENQHTTPARHNIDFAERCAETSRQDAVALGNQQRGRPAFRRKPKAKSNAALRVVYPLPTLPRPPP